MKVAVMQPYFLPYLGYWQLMGAVDQFVIFDDVAFIQKGWINRNRLLLNGAPHLFTLPLENASQNRLISEIRLLPGAEGRKKILATVHHAYARAPFFQEAFALVEEVVMCSEEYLAPYLAFGIKRIARHLGFTADFTCSSGMEAGRGMKGSQRIIALCKALGADEYINPPGGAGIYQANEFSEAGIHLRFLQPGECRYRQFGGPFVPWLSIVDILMFNNSEAVAALLADCQNAAAQ